LTWTGRALLYAYAMTLTHNQAEAEDLVQETYLRALGAFKQLRPDSNLKSWLFTILRNVRLNQLRRIQGGPRIIEMEGRANEATEFEDKGAKDPYASYVIKLTHSDVRSAVENLPGIYREVILLREFEDLSYKEIAEILDCPAGTVMSRLGRAREKLKEMLQHWSIRTVPAASKAAQP
jgi:RNA polymerase sigma-70 factor, ECF subfamily